MENQSKPDRVTSSPCRTSEYKVLAFIQNTDHMARSSKTSEQVK
jgi:hypothetical protein